MRFFPAQDTLDSKKLFKRIFVGAVVIAVIFFAFPALAQEGEGTVRTLVFQIVSSIASGISWVLGKLILLTIKLLVYVANYTEITAIPTVNDGWKIVRDICNMFFVLILLFIAFATILRVENYSVNKMLPKILIVAVFINFSKTIFAFIVDFSQVIMLSFAVPLRDSEGLVVDAFRMQTFGEMAAEGGGAGFFETFAIAIASVFAAIVALIVLLVLVAVLVIRLILLWVYTILSPLAFLGFAFGPIQKYVGFIWQDFIKQAFVGPFLIFFVWLAILTSSQTVSILTDGQESYRGLENSAFFETGVLQHFIIVIALLIGGLMAAQQMGGAAASFAGKGVEAIRGRYGPTPMRYGRERLEAFQRKREGERKQRAEQGGERLYGLYKGLPGGFARGTQKAIGMPGSGEIWRSAKGRAGGIPGINRLKQWKEAKDTHRDKLIEAHQKKGQVWSDDGRTKYEYDDKKKQARAINVDEKGNEQVITGMSGKEANFRRGFKEGYAPATQIKDELRKRDIDNKKKNLESLTAAELKGVLEDRDTSLTDKIASALMSVQKKNFKEGEKDKFDQAKSYARQSLSAKKEFEDEADKSYAAWNNSKSEFINKADSGEIDLKKQDLSQYKEKMDYFAEAAGDNFNDIIKEVEKRSSQAADKVKGALQEKIKSWDNINMKDDVQKRVRNAYADRTGNFAEAFSTPGEAVDKNAMNDFVKSAKSDRLSNIMGAYTSDKNPPKQKEVMKETLKESLTQNQIENYSKKDVPDKYIEELRKIHNERQGTGN